MNDTHNFGRYHPLLDDFAAFEEAIQRPLCRFVWTNTLRTTPQRLSALLSADGFAPEPLSWNTAAFRITGRQEQLGSHWAYLAGFYQVQEAGSMLPVRLLAPQPGQRILDLCAAPGNKMAQIAVALGNKGTVVANDLVGDRMRPVRMHIDRLGLINVSITCHDGVNYPKAAGLFDGVLVDAPCSCEGVSRKIPGVLLRPDRPKKAIIKKQQLLLQQAVRLCRTAGRIVYSTCTYAPEENEAVVDALLRAMPGKVRILPASLPNMRVAPGITSWQGQDFHPDLRHTVRIWPHFNDTGGFYLALLERVGPPSRFIPQPSSIDDLLNQTDMPGEFSQTQIIFEFLANRFGIDAAVFRGLQFVRKNYRSVSVVASDHRPPLKPSPSPGLPFMHLNGWTPKITTAGAALCGPWAAHNVVDLSKDQLADYLSRQPVWLTVAQAEGCTGNGHVLIRHDGAVLGVGDYRRQEAKVLSYFPKHLASGTRISDLD